MTNKQPTLSPFACSDPYNTNAHQYLPIHLDHTPPIISTLHPSLPCATHMSLAAHRMSLTPSPTPI
jgi:hypothetical protein